MLIVALLCLVSSALATSSRHSVCTAWPGFAGTDAQCQVLQSVAVEASKQLQELGLVSERSDALVRPLFSPAHRDAAAKIQRWMQLAGLETWVDGVGNVHGHLASSLADAQTLVIGSHYDTVLDAGQYDGSLGILVGIAAAKALLLQANADQPWAPTHEALTDDGYVDVRKLLHERGGTASGFAHHLRVVAFSDEEGLRYQTTFLGSRALAGTLASSHLAARDAAAQTLAEVLALNGLPADRLQDVAMHPGSLRGYVEVHMEQGPVLQHEGHALGVVSGIVGQARLLVSVRGDQGHAGTVPMHLRRDPMPAAAQIIVALNQRCQTLAGNTAPSSTLLARLARLVPARARRVLRSVAPVFPVVAPLLQPDPPQGYLVCTVGRVEQWPGASNVIAGSVSFTVDIRAEHDTARHSLVQWLRAQVDAACSRAGVQCDVALQHAADTVHMDTALVARLTQAVRAGYDVGGAEALDVPLLASGAGHDAMAMAQAGPVGMLFVRCKDGISHSPLEFVAPEDVRASVLALHAFLANDLTNKTDVAT